MLPSSDRIIAGVDSSQGGLPLLPWDVLHLVLLHSDPHTLALVSRVSHDLYLAASDMLYKGPVRLSSLQALRMLFCERADGTMVSFVVTAAPPSPPPPAHRRRSPHGVRGPVRLTNLDFHA